MTDPRLEKRLRDLPPPELQRCDSCGHEFHHGACNSGCFHGCATTRHNLAAARAATACRNDTAARLALLTARASLALAHDAACDSAPGPLPARVRPAVMAHVREAREALDVIERVWGGTDENEQWGIGPGKAA